MKNWPPADWPETREEYLERMRSTPVHLCRLRYFGEDRWGFAFLHTAMRNTIVCLSRWAILGNTEEAFITSANVGLNE